MTSVSEQLSPPVSPQGPQRPYRGIVGRLVRLTLKELRETLRDRRTIITLLLMPILIYPLLAVAFQRFLLTSLQSRERTEYAVGVTSEQDAELLSGYLKFAKAELKRSTAQQTETPDAAQSQPIDLGSLTSPESPIFKFYRIDRPEDAVADGRVDVGIRIISTSPTEPGSPVPVAVKHQLILAPESPLSLEAAEYLEELFRAVNDSYWRWKLTDEGLDPEASPIQSSRTAVAGEGAPVQISIAALVPLILILMTITGAVYPAIDLTAGERERGTLEMLIAAPVPRLGLLLAKYVAVLTVALLTATVNLVAMTVTTLSIGLGPLLFGDAGLSPSVVLQIFLLLILFATFFSAILLSVTSFARSFKEAQAYLIPLMLVSLAPGMLSLVPGLELNGTLAVTPLVNIVLLARDLLSNAADATSAAVVVLSTAGYALLAIAVSARTFGSDAILYGSRGSWSDLFQRPAEKRSVATLSNAGLCLAIMLPGLILANSSSAQLQDLSLPQRLGLGAVLTALFCGGVPLVFALMGHVRLSDGFRLKHPPAAAWGAAALFGISLWPFAYEIEILLKQAGLVSFGADLVELVQKLAADLRTLPLVGVLIALAVVPAVFEELFFRGYLLGAVRERTGPVKAVLLTAVCFGLFHVVVRDVLALERLLPSTFLGLALGWVALRSGSVLPGVLLHACNNGLLLTASHYQEQLKDWNIFSEQAEHLPASVLGGAAAIALIATAILILAVHSEKQGPN